MALHKWHCNSLTYITHIFVFLAMQATIQKWKCWQCQTCSMKCRTATSSLSYCAPSRKTWIYFKANIVGMVLNIFTWIGQAGLKLISSPMGLALILATKFNNLETMWTSLLILGKSAILEIYTLKISKNMGQKLLTLVTNADYITATAH